ncbi:MAG: M1 family aminopeptidase, partial [Bacteroidia bacterium]
EYPMLTLDGGHWPSHQGLIAHEVGHNWFFGMLGSNEPYRASLDEGFTQFLPAWCMNALVKEPMAEYKRAFAGYMSDALDFTDPSLATHSHDFKDATGHGGGYRHVYYKTATMLYNLRYVLGDSLFRVAMQHYVAQWKMCHPYPEDFRKSITEAVETDLTWFFDGWMNDTRHIDYSIASVNQKGSRYTITVQRKGDQLMPIDLDITYENGQTFPLTIPVSHFQKPNRVNTGLWEGWASLRPTYSLSITPDFPIAKIEIDPSGHLADVNRVDNVWTPKMGHGRTHLALDKGQAPNQSYLSVYQALWRPALSYGGVEGFKPGLAWSSQYAGRRHIIDARLWYNSYSAQTPVVPAYPSAWASAPNGASAERPLLSYRFSWSHQVPKNGRYFWKSASQAGLFYNRLGWDMQVGEHLFGLDALSMNRYRFTEVGDAWSSGHNLSMNLFWKKGYQTFGGRGSLRVDSRLSSPFADAAYGFVSFEWKHQQNLGKTPLRLRAFTQMFAGSNIPAESMLYAAGANPEQSYENELLRNL